MRKLEKIYILKETKTMAKMRNILMVLGGGALAAVGIGKLVKDRKSAELEEEIDEETEEDVIDVEVEETEE
jgi:hypothetical protein